MGPAQGKQQLLSVKPTHWAGPTASRVATLSCRGDAARSDLPTMVYTAEEFTTAEPDTTVKQYRPGLQREGTGWA